MSSSAPPSHALPSQAPWPAAWWRVGLDAQQAARRWTDLESARWPIVTLGTDQRADWLTALLALDPADRLMRFGHAAGDEQIRRYVEGIDFEADIVLAVLDGGAEVIAGAHVAFSQPPGAALEAEFGVHVAPAARRSGLGRRLFDQAQLVARNRGAESLFVHSLLANGPMQRIVQASDAVTTRDGAETSSRIALAEPNLVTQLDEALARHAAIWRGIAPTAKAWLPSALARLSGLPDAGAALGQRS